MPEYDNPEISRFRRRLDEWARLSVEERTALSLAVLERTPKERAEKGQELLRREYPSAAPEMIHSAAFHAYMELPNALRNCLAWLELCLREDKHDQHSGINFDVVYHLYNWLQAETLIPWGRQDVFDSLNDIKDCLRNDDKEGAIGNLEALLERFESSVSPPEVET